MHEHMHIMHMQEPMQTRRRYQDHGITGTGVWECHLWVVRTKSRCSAGALDHRAHSPVP